MTPDASGTRTVRITKSWRPVLTFLGLTFAITWSAWGLLLVLGGEPTAGPVHLALWVVGGLGPAAALIAARLEGRSALRALWHGLLRWRVGARWYALLLLPLVVAVAAVTLLGWRVDPEASVVGAAIAAVPMFVAMAVVGGGLEEVGWRGYAQPRVQAHIGQLPAAVAIGIIWALWHLPLYAMVGTSQSESSLGWFTLQAVALSIILAWIYNGTGASILLPVLFHSAVNTSYSTVLDVVDVVAQTRFEMVAALLMSAAALVVIRRSVPQTSHLTGVPMTAPTVADNLRLEYGVKQDEFDHVVEVLDRLDERLRSFRAEAVELRLSVKERDEPSQRTTLEAIIAGRPIIVATSEQEDFDAALAEVRDDLIRQITDAKNRTEPMNNPNLRDSL